MRDRKRFLIVVTSGINGIYRIRWQKSVQLYNSHHGKNLSVNPVMKDTELKLG